MEDIDYVVYIDQVHKQKQGRHRLSTQYPVYTVDQAQTGGISKLQFIDQYKTGGNMDH